MAALLLATAPAAALAGPTIHWGQYATVRSETDGNGLYTYSLTAGTDPLTFIAGQGHVLELSFHGMRQIRDTAGWESSSPSENLVRWTYIGADPLTLGDTPIVFSAQSSISEFRVWPVDLGNPPAPSGLVVGETESVPYGIDAFEPFSFVAPIPEPSALALFAIGGFAAALATRRRSRGTAHRWYRKGKHGDSQKSVPRVPPRPAGAAALP